MTMSTMGVAGSMTSNRATLGVLAAVAAAVTLVAAAVTLVAAAGCSSAADSDPDAWAAAYVHNPDRVWAAIHDALDELGYEVEEEDRLEGRIRAAEITDDPYRGVVLQIDQVQRTEVVRVFVRPSVGSAGGPEGFARRDEAVREFLDALDRRLGRRASP